MPADALRELVGEAMLAPSVHNVQPARWRIADARTIDLFEDVRTRLAVGDPRGNDAGISLGAAAEGLQLAASRRGLALERHEAPPQTDAALVPVARYVLTPSDAPPDPLAACIAKRASWRGDFARAGTCDREAAQRLAGPDTAILADPAALREAARIFDAASYGFMRDDAFRAELRSWMRFTRRHPRWARDGLNAAAMALGRVEAVGASLVLGPAFGILDRIGLAPSLLAEGKKVAAAAGLAVLHRPSAEPPFESGAHFYRLWLRIEAAGLGAAVLAALADDPAAARQIAQMAGVPSGHRIVSAFRFGRRPAGAAVERARRGLAEVLV
jgi:nitroreductase